MDDSGRLAAVILSPRQLVVRGWRLACTRIGGSLHTSLEALSAEEARDDRIVVGVDAGAVSVAFARDVAGHRLLLLAGHEWSDGVGDWLSTRSTIGVVTVRDSIAVVGEALLSVTERQPFISATAAPLLLQHWGSGQGAQVPHELPALSIREREVLQAVIDGRSVKETAAMLAVSPKTVEVHRSRLYRKLGVDGRLQAARLAHRFPELLRD